MARLTIGPFSIEVPVNWTLSTLILAGPMPDEPEMGLLRGKVRPFQRNLVATMEAITEADTAEGYLNRQIAGLREAGVVRLEGKPPERVQLEGGREALLTEQVIVSQSGERVRQMQLVSFKDGIAYTIIASHLDGAPFDAASDQFRQMLLSFK